MRKSAYIIIIAIAFFFSGCQNLVEIPAFSYHTTVDAAYEIAAEPTAEVAQAASISATTEPTLTISPAAEPSTTETVKPTEQPVERPTEHPTAISTQAPLAQPTDKPAHSSTEVPTPKPTEEQTPEPQIEITPVSSSYIKAAMAEINRLREANGVEPATFSSSISSSCKGHAVKMAESGSVFHASGVYMFEAVGRASKHMSGSTMGGAAANHVVQLQSAEVTKIGIGAVYCGDYVYYVVRGD